MLPPAGTGSLLLEARQVTYAVKDMPILHGLSCRLQAGEILGVIGPNGAGKSTFLKTLSGILAPTQGSVRYQGQPAASFSRKQLARLLACVNPRDTLPAFPMQVEQYVSLGRTPYLNWLGMLTSQDEACISQALEACHVTPFKDKPLPTLSSGEWQKVQLARALTQAPRLLFLDEPTSHLDLAAQMELVQLLRATAAQGETGILIVLHDLNLAALCCDRLLLLRRGECLAEGTPQEVLTEANISQVYGPHWKVGIDADSQAPFLLPHLR